MKYQVVYNDCFGGYGLSIEAVEYMAKLGHPVAKEAWNEYQREKDSEQVKKSPFPYRFFELEDKIPRHDPILVKTVKKLKSKAGGVFADLKIAKLDTNIYRIDEYDGAEIVQELAKVKDWDDWITIPT